MKKTSFWFLLAVTVLLAAMVTLEYQAGNTRLWHPMFSGIVALDLLVAALGLPLFWRWAYKEN